MRKDSSISLGMTAKRLGMTKAAAALLCLLTVWNCSYDNLSLPQEAEEETVADNPANTVPGKLIIRVSDTLASEIENATDEEGNVELPEVKSLSADAIPLEITSMERLFPYAGKFEARTREAGLHKWYVIRYDESVATKSATAALTLPGVETIEIPHRIVRIGGEGPVEYIYPAKAGRAENAVFDDPMLGNQWHYYNDGSANSSVSGCDINVIPVWQRYTTGNPDVIVSVVDGGIDFDHEDLAANMWENPEETGERRFGFNFVTGGPKVTADDHGTHVAGTIAAVNNNGIGVCGVAGGNAAAGQSGVKLMSCQIFQGEDGADGAEAIKWGADHGAVISQNSWGYTDATYTPQYLKDAVDYFVRNAGVDENGVQTGPMIGGLVVFAAGNDNSSFGYPAEYEPIVAVSSVGADYKRAYYSNYGDWTDIIAPGGDAKKGNQVVSTLPDNKYGMMQGTSMACPHVSGIAALIVSRFGGPGFTVAALKERLLDNVTDISGFNPGYYLGNGLANAYLAIAGSGGIPPQAPTNLEATALSNNITVSVDVPADEDDITPYTILVYYDTEPEVTEESMFAIFYVGDLEPGDRLTGTIGGLEFEKTYYLKAVASDLAANKSDFTNTVSVATGPNTAPVINALSGNSVELKPHETIGLEYGCSDPDGHFYTIELEPGSEAAVLDTIIRDKPIIRITGANAASGTYTARLTVTDIYGASTSAEAEYTILENHEPYVAKNFENLVFSSRNNGTIVFTASDYFKDDDGEQLAYTIEISDPSVLNMTYAKGNFNLTTMNYGYCDVTVTGTDVRGASASQAFKVLVKNGDDIVESYPNPVTDLLYLRAGEDTSVSYGIYASNGRCVLSGSVDISPFAPATIDVSGLPGGVYRMEIVMGSDKLTKTFVKL